MIYIQVKAMAGTNYVRANDVLAVQFTDREKCTLMLTGGILMPCYEPAATVVGRLEEQMGAKATPATVSNSAPDGKEPRDGDGSA